MNDKVPVPVALRAATQLIETLTPACESIWLCGSLRRILSSVADMRDASLYLAQLTVSDVDVVVVPRYQAATPKREFGQAAPKRKADMEPINLAWECMDSAGYQPWQDPKRWGALLRKVCLVDDETETEIKCDVNVATPDNLGYKIALATGDAAWNKAMVTPRWKGGLRPNELTTKDAVVFVRGEPVAVPTEERFFEVMRLRWLAPHYRNERIVERLVKSISDQGLTMEGVRTGGTA